MVTEVLRRIRSLLPGTRRRPVARCARFAVRSEHDIRSAAYHIGPAVAPGPGAPAAAAVESLLRELVALNTPALFLNIVQHGGPVRVVLHPWDGGSIRFRGSSYFVDAGSESVEGIEAFANAPFSHVTTLYPTAPDHPVYVISIENQGANVYHGSVPSYLTNLTIMVNGRPITRGERLLHERGPQVWAAA